MWDPGRGFGKLHLFREVSRDRPARTLFLLLVNTCARGAWSWTRCGGITCGIGSIGVLALRGLDGSRGSSHVLADDFAGTGSVGLHIIQSPKIEHRKGVARVANESTSHIARDGIAGITVSRREKHVLHDSSTFSSLGIGSRLMAKRRTICWQIGFLEYPISLAIDRFTAK